MRVTMICSTARLGGLDFTLHGLSKQTRSPDLFVLVDEWWHLRFSKLKLDKQLTFPCLHIFPGWDSFGVSRLGRGHNIGAQHGREGLLIFINDWLLIPPDLVERMAGYAERNPGWSLSGAQFRYDLSDVLEIDVCSSLRPGVQMEGLFDRYAPIFKDYRDGLKRGEAPEGLDELPPDHWFGGINDSILAEYWHGMGGTDERYDGAGGGQDIDLAFRASQLGARFAFDSTLINHEVRGLQHDNPAYHRCPVKVRPDGLEHVQEFMTEYHRSIVAGERSVDWREDAKRFPTLSEYPVSLVTATGKEEALA